MELFKAIFERRSIRKYKSGDIPTEQMEQILRAGMYAPTARNTQSWQFVVVENRMHLIELAGIHPYGKMLSSAAAAILVCGDKSVEPLEGYLVENASASIQNILLACHGLGLGSVWLGVYPRENRMSDLSKWFGLPEEISPIGLIAIGIPDEEKPVPERWDPKKVHYGKW